MIVGGGIGGIALARKLANHPGFDITLLDRQNHFVLQPLLYQVATSALGATDIAVPIRFLLRQARNVRVLQAEVTGVDAQAKRVDTSVGTFDYELLVVASPPPRRARRICSVWSSGSPRRSARCWNGAG